MQTPESTLGVSHGETRCWIEAPLIPYFLLDTRVGFENKEKVKGSANP
jgi:hypothetical protein